MRKRQKQATVGFGFFEHAFGKSTIRQYSDYLVMCCEWLLMGDVRSCTFRFVRTLDHRRYRNYNMVGEKWQGGAFYQRQGVGFFQAVIADLVACDQC